MIAAKLDRTKSRRRLARSDADVLVELREERQRLELQVEMLEEIAAAMDESPAYAKVIKLSYERLKQLEQKSMGCTDPDPVRETIMRAELRGQWKERFLITQQHSDILRKKEESVRGLRLIGRRLMALLKKLESE
jgi:hypothetical protein